MVLLVAAVNSTDACVWVQMESGPARQASRSRLDYLASPKPAPTLRGAGSRRAAGSRSSRGGSRRGSVSSQHTAKTLESSAGTGTVPPSSPTSGRAPSVSATRAYLTSRTRW